MQITTSPTCRIGSEGQTLHYAVRAQGASELSLPTAETTGLHCRIINTRPTADGVEAQLEVKVLDSTPY